MLEKLLESILDKAPYMAPSLFMLIVFVWYVKNNVAVVRSIYTENTVAVKALADSCHIHQEKVATQYATISREMASVMTDSAKMLARTAATIERIERHVNVDQPTSALARTA